MSAGGTEWDGWVAAVIPDGARRFRVDGASLAAALASAGGELVEDRPDVEIGAARHVRGDAAWAVVPIEPTLPEGSRRLVRAGRRVAAFARASIAVARARRALARRGYERISVVRWDIEQVLRRPGPPDGQPRLRAAERLAGGAVVVGARRPAEPTVLDAAATAAAQSVGVPRIDTRWPTVRGSGVLVIRDERRVFRVAVGPQRREIERHCAALELLRASAPPPPVADRAPRVESHGTTGLACWSLEQRLAGDEPHALDATLRADCVDFLVALHACGVGPGRSLVACAEVVGGECTPSDAGSLSELAAALEARLAGFPRGFGHGDFWHGNLLVERGRLRGVVDWAAAGPGRLPLLDLIGLLAGEVGSRYFGRTLRERLLPWARAGGDDLSREYCLRLGLEVDAAQLEALVIAYWVDRAARELETYADRRRRPVWLRDNVTEVVPALTGSLGV